MFLSAFKPNCIISVLLPLFRCLAGFTVVFSTFFATAPVMGRNTFCRRAYAIIVGTLSSLSISALSFSLIFLGEGRGGDFHIVIFRYDHARMDLICTLAHGFPSLFSPPGV